MGRKSGIPEIKNELTTNNILSLHTINTYLLHKIIINPTNESAP